MRNLFHSGVLAVGSTVTLKGEERRYLVRVLRKSKGDLVPLLDAAGRRFEAELGSISERSATLTVVRQLEMIKEPDGPIVTADDAGPVLSLYQCLPKGRRMDDVVRMAVEAGVSRIVPVLSRYTVKRPDRDDEIHHLDRWRRIVKEAVQQCGRPSIPSVEKILGLEEIPAPGDGNAGLVFHERPIEQSSLHRYLSFGPKRVDIVIGPEGGLAAEEVDRLRELGFRPVWLGANVLRTETAAIAAIAAVSICLLEKNTWIPN